MSIKTLSDLYVDGKIGIGVSTPAADLHIEDAGNSSSGIRIEAVNEGTQDTVNMHFQGTGAGAPFYISRSNTGGAEVQLQFDGDVILNGSNGDNCGIGTTSPSQKLDVNGNVRFRNRLYASNNSAGSSGQVLSSTGTGTQWISVTSDTGVPAILSNGSTPSLNTGITAAEIRSLIGAGTGNGTVTGTGVSGRVAFWNSGSSLSYDNLYWDTANDRLGIGVATPLQSLDVSGNQLLRGSLYLDSGTSNRLYGSGGALNFDTNSQLRFKVLFGGGAEVYDGRFLVQDGSGNAEIFGGNQITQGSAANYGFKISSAVNTGMYIDTKYATSGQDIYFRNVLSGSTPTKFQMDMTNGTFTASGDLVAYGSPSDKKLKENIKPIENALDKVEKLNGVSFDWKDKGLVNIKEDLGFIAQDVKEVLPELVRENEEGNLSLRHQGIIPVLLEAIKELSEKVKALENGSSK